MTRTCLTATGILALASVAHAGPTYLTQMRYVEATADAGGDMVDMERRVSMDFGGFDQTATAHVDYVGGGFIDAAISQQSTFDDAGITASFGGSLNVGERSASEPGGSASIKTVLESTFVLDGPHSYVFYPLGTGSAPSVSGSAAASITGDTSVQGPDLDVTLNVASGLGEGEFTDPQPLTGELAGGTYTFKYAFTGTGSGEAGLNFDGFDPQLSFTSLSGGGTNVPATVPLPAAGWAGLATLGGLMGVGRKRLKRLV